MGGKFHLKLNNGERPIANKYREGKMKRTLKRELKVLEIVKREAIGTSRCAPLNQPRALRCRRWPARGPWWSPSCGCRLWRSCDRCTWAVFLRVSVSSHLRAV